MTLGQPAARSHHYRAARSPRGLYILIEWWDRNDVAAIQQARKRLRGQKYVVERLYGQLWTTLDCKPRSTSKKNC